MKTKMTISTMAALTIFFVGVSANATIIPVPNGDFELAAPFDTWTYVGSAGRQTFPYNSMDQTGHGNALAYINNGSYAAEFVPGQIIEPHTTYTLTVDVGKTLDAYWGTPELLLFGNDGIVNLQLTGGTLLTGVEPAATQWSTWAMQWNSDSTPAAIGKPLLIRLSTSSGTQDVYDNVQLEAVGVPEPSVAGLLLIGGVGCALVRRKIS